jgi:hypothetical protein
MFNPAAAVLAGRLLTGRTSQPPRVQPPPSTAHAARVLDDPRLDPVPPEPAVIEPAWRRRHPIVARFAPARWLQP